MNSIPEIFKSKRFWSAVGYVASLVVVFYLPEFQGSEEEVASGLTLVFGLLIGGYAAEDVVQAIVIARSLAAKTATKYDDMAVAVAEAAANSAGLNVPPAQEVNVNVS